VIALESPREAGDPVVLCLRIESKYRHLVQTRSRVQIQSEGMIGGRVVEILPAPRASPGEPLDPPAPEGHVLESQPTTELADLMTQTGQTLESLRSGKGSIARLTNDPTAHDSAVAALKQVKETASSIQQVADGMQKVPFVGGYLQRPESLLNRPECNQDRRVLAETDLFEPGKAILTTQGRSRLDQKIAPWLEGMKHKGSEVVVVAYADPAHQDNARVAKELTTKQSEAVCEYLKKRHSVQKMGWWSSRKVMPLGQGINPPPIPERENLEPARVEILVFVPVRD